MILQLPRFGVFLDVWEGAPAATEKENTLLLAPSFFSLPGDAICWLSRACIVTIGPLPALRHSSPVVSVGLRRNDDLAGLCSSHCAAVCWLFGMSRKSAAFRIPAKLTSSLPPATHDRTSTCHS
jgi:hypothetical protein